MIPGKERSAVKSQGLEGARCHLWRLIPIPGKIQDHAELGITGSSMNPSLGMDQLHPEGKSRASSSSRGRKAQNMDRNLQDGAGSGIFPAWIPLISASRWIQSLLSLFQLGAKCGSSQLCPFPLIFLSTFPLGRDPWDAPWPYPSRSRSQEVSTKPSPGPQLSSHFPHLILIFSHSFPSPKPLPWDEGNHVLDSPGEPNPLWSRIPRDFEAGISKQKGSGPAR